ncbi:MAG TPA: hypothetical protein VFO84_02670 [Dehalococcoidia bacterium]|nr:hypothetical protein [Dehalococcoidia bacterium]
MDSASRLPVVRQPRYVTATTPMQALAVTAKRGALLMAAGAIARIVAKQIASHMLRNTQQLSTRKSAAVVPMIEQSPELVEEVVYFRRRLYRRD